MEMAVQLCLVLKSKKIPSVMRSAINQIKRCSSAVAANFRATIRARSEAEFYAKICIVTEKCDETLFWLDYLIGVAVLNRDEIQEIRSEVDKLTRLFGTIKSKMKVKMDRKVGDG
jgi:four helix bundle protein